MRIALALGSGSSRGWSHLGVIRALQQMQIEPDIICGTSIGALVGAAYASGNLHKLESWALSLSKMELARYFELNWSLNGFVNLRKLKEFLELHVCPPNMEIERLNKTFATVATDLETGREVWFTEGKVFPAMSASMALPGLFAPVRHDDRWLVDGGLVNPVPVSVCRALGADVVIAVNLNGNIVGKHFYHKPQRLESDSDNSHRFNGNGGLLDKLANTLMEYTTSFFPDSDKSDDKEDMVPPGLYDALAGSINITQDRITRSRMAGDPPDILLSPRLSHIGLFEFYRAREVIAEGEACVQRMSAHIKHNLGHVPE